MSLLNYQFIAFIQRVICRENDVIGFALSKMLQSRSILAFYFFLPHVKLESSVEFLFDSYLKELLCL